MTAPGVADWRVRARRLADQLTADGDLRDPSWRETIQVSDGMRVCEIGTGTGYNAALLCHRLGDTRVCSIDIDPALVAAARTRLARLRYHPTLIAADGADGSAAHAPFDRNPTATKCCWSATCGCRS